MSKNKKGNNGFNRLKSAAVGGAAGLMMAGGAAFAASFTINRTRATANGGASNIDFVISSAVGKGFSFGIQADSMVVNGVKGMQQSFLATLIGTYSRTYYWHSKLPSTVVDGHKLNTTTETTIATGSHSYFRMGTISRTDVSRNKLPGITDFPNNCGAVPPGLSTLNSTAFGSLSSGLNYCYYGVMQQQGTRFTHINKQATATRTYSEAFYEKSFWAKVDDNSFANPTSGLTWDGATNTATIGKDLITTGIDAQIDYYFPVGTGVIRALYTLTNTTGADIDTTVEIGGELGSETTTTVELSQSGDTLADNTDQWHITSDLGRGDPFVTISRYGDGARSIPSQQAIPGGPDLINTLKEFNNLYQVTVPANGSASILVFAEVNAFLATAESSAAAFESLTAADAAGLLAGLTDEQKAAIQNYDVDSDGDGVFDSNDAFPDDATETVDTDGDGVGDNSDAFPDDATETVDTDGDGVGDNSDAFPNDPSRSVQPSSGGGSGSLSAESLLFLLSSGITGFVLRRRKRK